MKPIHIVNPLHVHETLCGQRIHDLVYCKTFDKEIVTGEMTTIEVCK